MKHFKVMRRLKLYVWQGHGYPDCDWDYQWVVPANHAVDREPESVQREALLLKEIEETNNWARLGSQLYFAWVTLHLAVNGVGMAWLVSKGAVPSFAAFGLFMLNLMGTLVTIFVAKYMVECDGRIQGIIGSMTRNHNSEDPFANPRSPIPRQAVMILYTFTAIALITLTAFWTILWVSGGRA